MLLFAFVYPHFYGSVTPSRTPTQLSAPPGTGGHPFGTDDVGQDLLARMMLRASSARRTSS